MQLLYLHKFKGRKLDCVFQVIPCYGKWEHYNYPTTTNSRVYLTSLGHTGLYWKQKRKFLWDRSTHSMKWMLGLIDSFQKDEPQKYNIHRYLQLSAVNKNSPLGCSLVHTGLASWQAPGYGDHEQHIQFAHRYPHRKSFALSRHLEKKLDNYV